MYVCVCVGLPVRLWPPKTAAPIVTKLGLQTLNITSSKLIPTHLTFEAEIEVQSSLYYTILHRP